MTTATKIKPGPITSAESVRAIIRGDKTQIRCVCKLPSWATACCESPQRDIVPHSPGKGSHPMFGECYLRVSYCESCDSMGSRIHAPLMVGDIVYVREAWRAGMEWDGEAPSEIEPRSWHDGRADVLYEATPDSDTKSPGEMGWGRLRSPLHMPRWAARLFLRIERVRVERVQEISEADAMDEGLWLDLSAGWHWKRPAPTLCYASWRQAIRDLWDSINAKRGYPWASNPWVWAYDFTRVEKP